VLGVGHAKPRFPQVHAVKLCVPRHIQETFEKVKKLALARVFDAVDDAAFDVNVAARIRILLAVSVEETRKQGNRVVFGCMA